MNELHLEFFFLKYKMDGKSIQSKTTKRWNRPRKEPDEKKKKKTKMLEHALKTKLELSEAYYPLQEPLS